MRASFSPKQRPRQPHGAEALILKPIRNADGHAGQPGAFSHVAARPEVLVQESVVEIGLRLLRRRHLLAGVLPLDESRHALVVEAVEIGADRLAGLAAAQSGGAGIAMALPSPAQPASVSATAPTARSLESPRALAPCEHNSLRLPQKSQVVFHHTGPRRATPSSAIEWRRNALGVSPRRRLRFRADAGVHARVPRVHAPASRLRASEVRAVQGGRLAYQRFGACGAIAEATGFGDGTGGFALAVALGGGAGSALATIGLGG